MFSVNPNKSACFSCTASEHFQIAYPNVIRHLQKLFNLTVMQGSVFDNFGFALICYNKGVCMVYYIVTNMQHPAFGINSLILSVSLIHILVFHLPYTRRIHTVIITTFTINHSFHFHSGLKTHLFLKSFSP